MVEGGQKLHGFVLWRKWSTLGETSNQSVVQSSAQEVLLSFIFAFSLYFLVLHFKVKLNSVKQLTGGVWTVGHLETKQPVGQLLSPTGFCLAFLKGSVSQEV